ncbi:MAG: type II toxin-antitoxin system VapC family toxin [Acidobacteriota bacterium]
MIVLDASALLEVLLNRPPAEEILDRISGAGESLHVPHILDVEVLQVLRRYSLTGDLDPARGEEAVQDLLDFRLNRYPHEPLLPRVWELRHNLTAYDAVYVALAEALDAPLLTRDAKLASATGHAATIVGVDF